MIYHDDPLGFGGLLWLIQHAFRILRAWVWIVFYPPVGLGAVIRGAIRRTGPVSAVGRWLLLMCATLFMDLSFVAGAVNAQSSPDSFTSYGTFLVIPALQVGGFIWGLAGRPWARQEAVTDERTAAPAAGRRPQGRRR